MPELGTDGSLTDPSARPERLVVVSGTGTEVGKTWVAAAVLRECRRRGLSVAARKPAQSFDADTSAGTDNDAVVLAAASGEDPAAVCRDDRSFPRALAPPMAAEALGRPPFTVADLVAELDWPRPRVRLGVVELAGGVRSPQAAEGMPSTSSTVCGPTRSCSWPTPVSGPSMPSAWLCRRWPS